MNLSVTTGLWVSLRVTTGLTKFNNFNDFKNKKKHLDLES